MFPFSSPACIFLRMCILSRQHPAGSKLYADEHFMMTALIPGDPGGRPRFDKAGKPFDWPAKLVACASSACELDTQFQANMRSSSDASYRLSMVSLGGGGSPLGDAGAGADDDGSGGGLGASGSSVALLPDADKGVTEPPTGTCRLEDAHRSFHPPSHTIHKKVLVRGMHSDRVIWCEDAASGTRMHSTRVISKGSSAMHTILIKRTCLQKSTSSW